MKEEFKRIGYALLLGVLLPWLVFGAAWEWMGPESERNVQRNPQMQSTEPKESTKPPQTSQTISVMLEDGSTVSMELTEYLTGVLLRELPGEFEPEAKMAQAVVARTYAIRTVQKAIKHNPGAVCTNSACCQGFISVEDYLEQGGSAQTVAQAMQAVTATASTVLTFDGALIDATYFSCSGGKTEDAVAVWGSDIPYLQSVESPGEEHAAHYTDTVSYTAQAFEDALGVSLSGSCSSWFGAITYTEGGGVDSISIGGTIYKGTTIRKLLGLRSTAFTLTATADSVVITTRGFGHRVGMSQYGADAMAASGKTWQQILEHYYRGAKIDKLSDLG